MQKLLAAESEINANDWFHNYLKRWSNLSNLLKCFQRLFYYGEHKLIFRKRFIFLFWWRHVSSSGSPQSSLTHRRGKGSVLLLFYLFVGFNMIPRNTYEEKAEWTGKGEARIQRCFIFFGKPLQEANWSLHRIGWSGHQRLK